MRAGVETKLREEMWVGQESNVEDQVRALRHTVLETEAQGRNQQRLALFTTALEKIDQVRAQFVDVELRGIDLQIRNVADRLQPAALADDRGGHRVDGAEGMGTAGFTEAPHQHFIARIEVDQGDIQLLLEVADDCRELLEAAALANIYHDGCILVIAGILNELGKAGNQLCGQIVHAVIAHVLENL